VPARGPVPAGARTGFLTGWLRRAIILPPGGNPADRAFCR